MDLKEKLDRQIALAVRDTVVLLARGESPDAGNLALAIASGETSQSLAGKAQEKVDRRSAAKAEPDKPAAAVPVPPAEEAVEVPHDKPRSHHKK